MNLSSFDLNLLRVLNALLETGSTVAAADRVGLSQPAVSAALKRLRFALGDPLFVRHGQRLEPTEYARALSIPLTEALDGLNELLAGPTLFDPSRENRTFVISSTDYFAFVIMPRLAEFFMTEAPDLKATMVDINGHNYLQTLESGRADIALLPLGDIPSWAEHEAIFDAKMVLAARKGHPRLERAGLVPGDVVPIDLFCDLGFVFMSPEGLLRGRIDEMLEDIGRERRVVMSMPFFSGVRYAVEGSDLVALIPLEYVKATGAPLDMYQLPINLPPVQLSMSWHKRLTSDPGHRWLREKVKEIMRDIGRRYYVQAGQASDE